jgi:hypothetical protein
VGGQDLPNEARLPNTIRARRREVAGKPEFRGFFFREGQMAGSRQRMPQASRGGVPSSTACCLLPDAGWMPAGIPGAWTAVEEDAAARLRLGSCVQGVA